jgi:hypothetical protein
MAVTWKGSDEDFVPLVLSHSPTHVRCLLYNAGTAAKQIRPTFWELTPGRYDLSVGTDANGDDQADSISTRTAVTIDGPTEATFALPPGGPHLLSVTRGS